MPLYNGGESVIIKKTTEIINYTFIKLLLHGKYKNEERKKHDKSRNYRFDRICRK